MTESYRNCAGKSTHHYTFSQKWGDDPFTALGHTQFPNALMEYAARIGLKDDECWLIACILMFKHTPDSPFPSQERLARLLGKSARTIRRRVEAIEQKGLIQIEYPLNDLGQHTHCVYDFSPLRAALNAVYYSDHPDERPEDLEPVAPLFVCLREGREPGYVYLLEGGGFHKIGKAADLDRRIQQIFPKLPFECRLLHAIPSEDCLTLEQWLHLRFAPQRRNGEWFQLEPDQVRWFLAQQRLEAADLA